MPTATVSAQSPAVALAALRVAACEANDVDPASPEGEAVMAGVTYVWHALRLWRQRPVDPRDPGDIRAAGWVVAVHNDYRLNGESHTFWLFTKGRRCAKGEGRSDAEALDAVRDAIGAEPAA